MNQKIEITKLVLTNLDQPCDDLAVKKILPVWWTNPRKKNTGGLRLTKKGFEALQSAQIKYHRIRFEEEILYTNRVIINLDNFISCPWYVDNKSVYVFGDKMAVQIILFSGNIAKFVSAKANRTLTRQ